MFGVKTNEREGVRATVRHSPMSAFKAREVLDLIRGKQYTRAQEILELSERGASDVVGKLLRSCAANAENNDGLDPEEMFVSACYADEGTTLKRWRPRARGLATRIRKRTCHITVILSRMPEEEIARRRARIAAEQAERRARRVAGARRGRRRTERAPAKEELPAAEELTALTADTEALDALSEARALESESRHGELESEAESALDFGPEPEASWVPTEKAPAASAEGADEETEPDEVPAAGDGDVGASGSSETGAVSPGEAAGETGASSKKDEES